MIAQVNIVLNGIVYCLKGMEVIVVKGKGKYSTVKRLEDFGEESKEIIFLVSNDLIKEYFSEIISYPQP